MEFSFDKVANTLYIRISHEPVSDTEEIADGIIVDYNELNHIVGIEILNYSKRNLNLNNLIQLNAEEIIPMIVQCQ